MVSVWPKERKKVCCCFCCVRMRGERFLVVFVLFIRVLFIHCGTRPLCVGEVCSMVFLFVFFVLLKWKRFRLFMLIDCGSFK